MATDDWRKIVKMQLMKQEGVKSFPYPDTAGKLTIGIGRNLTDKGLRSDEITFLFDHDIQDAEDDARALLSDPIFEGLTDNRKAVIVNMAFNLGLKKLSKFVVTLAAIKEGHHHDAAIAMLNSSWAKEIKGRATELSRLYEAG